MSASPRRFLQAFAFAVISGGALIAQALPTTQPKLLTIYREHIKTGHASAHAKTEAGWPAAYAQAKSPDYYLALSSMTGPSEVWFVAPWQSYTAWGKSMARDEANAELTAALDRLSEADAEHLDGWEIIEAIAAPELSHGAFPDLNRTRFWDLSVWRVRPGYDGAFAEAVGAYKKLVTRSGAPTNWRTYRVTAGMPSSTYILFSSVQSFDQFDAMLTQDENIMKAVTPEETVLFDKFFREGVISSMSNKFRLDPGMSYVSAETKATDPAFWKK